MQAGENGSAISFIKAMKRAFFFAPLHHSNQLMSVTKPTQIFYHKDLQNPQVSAIACREFGSSGTELASL